MIQKARYLWDRVLTWVGLVLDPSTNRWPNA